MNEHDDLFEDFKLLGPTVQQSAAAVQRVRHAVIAAAEEVPTVSHGPEMDQPKRAIARPSVWLTRGSLAVAATMLLVCGTFLFLQERDVMAQMIERMMESDSIRFVIQSHRTGGWNREAEFLYSREHGYLHQRYDDEGLLVTEVGDGVQDWHYRRVLDSMIRKPGRPPERMLQRLLDPLTARQGKLVREPEQDDTEHKWQCYVGYDVIADHRRRSRFWLDAEMRLRHFGSAVQVQGQWVDTFRGDARYDINISKADLEPDFGEARIVNIGDLVEGMLPLDDVVYRKTFTFYEIAVHEVNRIGDREYFLLLSFRPTEEALEKMTLDAEESVGDLHPGIRYQRHDGAPFQTVEHIRRLMDGTVGQLKVIAVLGYTDRQLPVSDVAHPEFVLFAHSQLWDGMKSISKVEIEVPLPDETTPLRDVVRKAYDLTAAMEESPGFGTPGFHASLIDELDGRTFVDRVSFGSRAYQEDHRTNPRPSEIDFDDFFQHVKDMPWRKDNRTVVAEEPE